MKSLISYPDLLLTKPKARSGPSCRVEFDVKKITKNTKISWFILKICAEPRFDQIVPLASSISKRSKCEIMKFPASFISYSERILGGSRIHFKEKKIRAKPISDRTNFQKRPQCERGVITTVEREKMKSPSDPRSSLR